MREPLPFESATWPRVIALMVGVFAVCYFWAYTVAQPPESTRSTTPEAWEPMTAPGVEPVLTEVDE